MKNIKQILAIAILGIFAVACTDENDLENNTTNHINKKTLEQDYGKYAFYEDKTFTDDQLSKMLYEFNNAVNNKDVTMPDYDISTALINMEFHFNYGVVVKMPFNKKAQPYDKLTFSFSVPIEDNIINGTNLKNAYINFVNNVVEEMNGRNMELSYLYVKDVSSTLVTFGLDMEPLRLPFGADDATMPAIKHIKDPNSVSIPSNVTSRWDNLPSWSLYQGYNIPYDHNYQRGAYEDVVHNYSFERFPIGYLISPNRELVYGHFRPNGIEKNVEGGYYTCNAGSSVIWNSDAIKDFVKKSIEAANDCNEWSQWGWVVYNFSSVIHFSKEVEISGQLKDKYQLRVENVRSAKLSWIDINELHMAAVTSPIINN